MKAIKSYVYCPLCGSRHFSEDSFKSRRCMTCGFEMFVNPSAAVAAFITNSAGELLLTRRRSDPAKGTLDLPGGFCDMEESAEQAVMREVAEETGLRVTCARYLFSIPNSYHFSGIDIPTLDLFFCCEVAKGAQPTPMDDAEECLWVPADKLDKSLFGLKSIRQAVEKYTESIKKNLKN